MACLSGEKNWVCLPKMLSHHVSLNEEKRDHDDDKPKTFGSQSTAYRLEKVFPVYAMGISKPDLDSDASLPNLGDPIWDAVRTEAKLEVCLITSSGLVSLFMGFY